jgi:hypothetical protein
MLNRVPGQRQVDTGALPHIALNAHAGGITRGDAPRSENSVGSRSEQSTSSRQHPRQTLSPTSSPALTPLHSSATHDVDQYSPRVEPRTPMYDHSIVLQMRVDKASPQSSWVSVALLRDESHLIVVDATKIAEVFKTIRFQRVDDVRFLDPFELNPFEMFAFEVQVKKRKKDDPTKFSTRKERIVFRCRSLDEMQAVADPIVEAMEVCRFEQHVQGRDLSASTTSSALVVALPNVLSD